MAPRIDLVVTRLLCTRERRCTPGQTEIGYREFPDFTNSSE